jgi:uncharacterized surface protein with fasciclin (FAS1) repeats
MSNRNFVLRSCLKGIRHTPKNWFAKLVYIAGITGVCLLIGVPALAKYYPRYALFQPYAHGNYPYRNSNNNIADTLTNESKYANLVDELKEAGLFDRLKQPGSLTIFAPTDEAFNALPDEIFQRYSQKENRIKVLKYHLVAGAIAAKDVDRGSVVTLEGIPVNITVNADGAVRLNEANAKHPSTVTKNGVIIEIDRVLMPPDLQK